MTMIAVAGIVVAGGDMAMMTMTTTRPSFPGAGGTPARPGPDAPLAIRARVLGPDHPDPAASLNNLAVLLQAQATAAGHGCIWSGCWPSATAAVAPTIRPLLWPVQLVRPAAGDRAGGETDLTHHLPVVPGFRP